MNQTLELEIIDNRSHTIHSQKIPFVGLGTWNIPTESVKNIISHAVEDLGYRHLDCASNYLNEAEIGDALHSLFERKVVNRSDLFITGKLNNPYHKKEHVQDHLMKTLKDLRVDYLDLWLIHWPFAYVFVPYDKTKRGYDKDYDPVGLKGVDLSSNGGSQFIKVPIQETWKAMEQCVRLGLVKAIGVANFTCALLYDLLSYAEIKPAVIQVECHPYNQHSSLIRYCQREKIVVEAYSPLGTPGFKQPNEPRVLSDPLIIKIAHSHSKTPAQICLRWQIQRGVVVLPKSVSPERLKENISVFGFDLTQEEMEEMSKIDKRYHFLNPDVWHGIPLFD